jgi:hypothetical protein
MTNLGTHMYDWVFHFNPYASMWHATTRDNYPSLFNGGKNILKSSSIDTLISLINKTNGDEKKLNRLTNDLPG